jgi:hypothetical protein
MTDERTGQVYDYSNQQGDVVASWLMMPAKAQAPDLTREQFWNMAESRETRVNSRTARTIEVALPHELTDKQREWLVKDYVREQFTRKGIAADVSIHKAHAHGDERNIHAHIVIATRQIDAHGLGAKERDFDRKETLETWRSYWEKLANRHLERHGHEARINMKSLEAQGIWRQPQIHVGQSQAAQERKGISTERGDQLRQIEAANQARAWTEGRPIRTELVPVAVESAVDRQKREDREERAAAIKRAEWDVRRASNGPSHAQRGLMAAIWSLARTAGASLSHVILGADRAELMHGRRIEFEQRPEQSAVPEKTVAQSQPEPTHAPRQFIDRGSRAMPYRAMLGELRDNDREAVIDREGQAVTGATGAQQAKSETMLERIDRERRERGDVPLRDVIGDRNDLERRRELEREGLEL